MEKLVYVLWNQDGASGADLRQALLGPVAKALGEGGAGRISLNVSDEDVTYALSSRLTRLDPPPAALCSFWLDCADDRDACEGALAEVSGRLAGYLVVESEPLLNTTHVALPGERTPGTNLVALIERPERMTWDAWIHHWHGHHKRVALETQCTYAYVRNVVVRRLDDDAPPWAGIVEEGFPAEAVTDPMKWYCADGDPEVLKRNLGRMLESCRAFLDLDRVESHPMSEYRLAR
jgi:hypothetical protein